MVGTSYVAMESNDALNGPLGDDDLMGGVENDILSGGLRARSLCFNSRFPPESNYLFDKR